MVNWRWQTFVTPATTKILAPVTDQTGRSAATFPLWTRKEEFGIISVFTGRDRTLFIENDRVPAGATVYFRNKPDLTIVGYGEREKK